VAPPEPKLIRPGSEPTTDETRRTPGVLSMSVSTRSNTDSTRFRLKWAGVSKLMVAMPVSMGGMSSLPISGGTIRMVPAEKEHHEHQGKPALA